MGGEKMMNKSITVITIIIFITIIFLFGVSQAYAAGLSIRLEQPKSPTSSNELKISFVTLDTQNQPITVKCFKKGPNEKDFVQFGADINLQAGGNSGECQVSSVIVSTAGSFEFYAQAVTGAESSISSTVTLDYQTGSPGTPTTFSKEQISSCEYKIKFKTAADNGKTKKVEVYMSTLLSFPADSGTKVGEVAIGSDQEGSFTKNTSPDCNKIYFAIRAFDGVGNGSGVLGDGFTTVITKTVTETVLVSSSPVVEAIPVNTSGVTSEEILSEESQATSSAVLGEEETPANTQGSTAQANSPVGRLIPFDRHLLSLQNLVMVFIPIFVAYLFYGYYRGFRGYRP